MPNSVQSYISLDLDQLPRSRSLERPPLKMRWLKLTIATLVSGALSARTYSQLTAPCKNAVAISGNLPCKSVADCEAQCDVQAAAAPGTGAATQ